MPVRLRLRTALVASAATLLALTLIAPPARANIYTQVLRAYEAQGSIPACQFSSRQLQSALKGIDTYGEQYFADFTVAVQNALAARASGACAPVAKPRAQRGPAVRGSLRPGPLTAATGASLPAPMLVMAGLAALFALIGAIAALWWWRGWDPSWAARWRHACGEAGYRARNTAAEFDDWLRSG